MKTIRSLCLLFTICLSLTLNAQTCDPWITQAYRELYKRTPSSEECNIKNYNNGSWRSYAELVNYIKTYTASKSAPKVTELKGDPWIFQAYTELYNRKPNAWELNVKNYNNGSWNSYADLKKYVKEFRASMDKEGILIKTADSKLKDHVFVVFEKDGKALAIDLVNVNAGKVVAAGGANVVAAGGGNVVAGGGLNLQVRNDMAGVSFGDKYRIQSTGTTKVVSTSGRGALVIR